MIRFGTAGGAGLSVTNSHSVMSGLSRRQLQITFPGNVRPGKGVVIGYDTRFLSEKFAQ